MIKIPDDVMSSLCEKFGTNREQTKFLGGGREDSDGTVFSFMEKGNARVLKVLAIPREEKDGLAKLGARIRFANFLGENGIDIAYPLALADGCLYKTEETEKHLFTAYKMKMYGGRHPKPEEWTPDFYREWGRVTGKLHRVTKSYPCWERIPVGSEGGGKGYAEELDMFYGWCRDPDVKQKWLEMKEILSALPLNRDTYGFIHNDNHVYNILWNSGSITLIDFDVANCHFFINDIAVTLQAPMFDVTGGMVGPVRDSDKIRSTVEGFLDGYEKENHLDDFWLKHINTFINYRRLLLFTVMQEWLDTKPELKQNFKLFIKDEPVIYDTDIGR